MLISTNINDRIENGIRDAMKTIVLDRMPTSRELRQNNYSWLDTLIGKNGGLIYWSNKLEVPRKFTKTKRQTDAEIEKDIYRIKKALNIARMPSSSEVIENSEDDRLHNNIIQSYGYREWAFKLNLPLKESETQLGTDYEEVIVDLLRNKGYKVSKMTTNHPFDLLIDNSVKIDVKVARPHMLRDVSRVHTFATSKRFGSCDLYIAMALNEADEIEKFLIIPSHQLQVVTLSIGQESKYDIYNNRFDLIDTYSKFFNSI